MDNTNNNNNNNTNNNNNNNNNTNNNIVLSKDTIKRLIKDVKELIQQPLTQHGIHYIHDETDMLKGRALIIGPKDTPYADGFYLFEFYFPANYPFSPPKLKYFTNDGITRFNPNLYKCGKVCLSIVNTWSGEQWSACQTISSVLLALCTILNNKPLLNEPGITENNKDSLNYNKIIKYKNIEVGICGMLQHEKINEIFSKFIPIMKNHFITNYTTLLQMIDDEISKQQYENTSISTIMYALSIKQNYSLLKNVVGQCYEKMTASTN